MNSKLSLSSTAIMNDGHKIPLLGMGGMGDGHSTPKGKTAQDIALWALEAGYRNIDTATLYENEEDIGIGIVRSGIPRDQIFITTKIMNKDQGYESTLKAVETSLSSFQTSYLDLVLIHTPKPGAQKRIESYKALQELVRREKVRSIGVSNYRVNHLKELMDTDPEIIPAVNQIEVHPWHTRKDIVSYCAEHNIIIQAFSPLTRGKKFNDPTLVGIAKKYNKTAAHILIRWGLQNNFVVLPKSMNKDRIIDNTKVYDFEIEEEDMKTLGNLDESFITSDNNAKVDYNLSNNKLIRRQATARPPQATAPAQPPPATAPAQPPQATAPAPAQPPSAKAPAGSPTAATAAPAASQSATQLSQAVPSSSSPATPPTSAKAPTPPANRPQTVVAPKNPSQPTDQVIIPAPSPQVPTQLPYGAGAEKLQSEKGNVRMFALGITIFLVIMW
ncbi:35382_t:CDS:2 [Racocetra persica]|uniref:35382_t:CDS:1 n=1 Tax=Racocetra persica TaxID=160502 RepID=A0ACA9KY19_9GLOM|nr:35382_t:CDS:2 [Racocetra persica]